MKRETVVHVVMLGYVAAFWAYVLTLAISPDSVAGPHSWEWAGATCPDPEGHHPSPKKEGAHE